jgi:membrane protein DedA with SNARE-associated domain
VGDTINQLLHWVYLLTVALNGSVDWVRTIDPSLRIVVAAVAILLEMFLITGLFVPGDIVLFLVAASFNDVGHGIALTVAVTIGALLGGIAGYYFGFGIGTASRRARSRRDPASISHVSSARRFLLRRGGPAVLASRFIPLAWTIMPFAAGLSGFSFRSFIAWSAPGTLVWSAACVVSYSIIGATLGQGEGSVLVLAALAVFGVLVYVGAFVAQTLSERRQGPDGVA